MFNIVRTTMKFFTFIFFYGKGSVLLENIVLKKLVYAIIFLVKFLLLFQDV